MSFVYILYIVNIYRQVTFSCRLELDWVGFRICTFCLVDGQKPHLPAFLDCAYLVYSPTQSCAQCILRMRVSLDNRYSVQIFFTDKNNYASLSIIVSHTHNRAHQVIFLQFMDSGFGPLGNFYSGDCVETYSWWILSTSLVVSAREETMPVHSRIAHILL